MSESTVLYKVENRIATITLNRPDKHNAMNYDLANDLHAAMVQADADDEVRVIVFTGAGKSFCVGADISAINRSNAKAAGAAADGAPAPKPRNMSKLFWPMDAGIRPDFQATHNYFPMIGKPIICMINGATAGVGISYACFSDMRFSADDVTFAAGGGMGNLLDPAQADRTRQCVGLPALRAQGQGAGGAADGPAQSHRAARQAGRSDL